MLEKITSLIISKKLHDDIRVICALDKISIKDFVHDALRRDIARRYLKQAEMGEKKDADEN